MIEISSNPMSEVVLQIEKLGKNYGKFIALNDFSFSVRKGEIIGLVGPNGAGKTTILKLIARLITQNSGKIFIANKNAELQDIHENSEDLIERGFLIDIPQFHNTNPWKLLRYIANIRNYPKNKINSRIDYLLKDFDLYKWKYKNIKTFSKGMSQKLGFIGAIIHEPELIILDEPQTGLDPESRMKIRKYLKSLQSEGKSILISSHLLSEIREICDKIVIINQGKLIGFDSIDNLERKFKAKQLVCEIDHVIPPEEIEPLLTKINQSLTDYLEETGKDSDSESNIVYKPEVPSLEIKYNGFREARSKILEILAEKFKSDFTISAFYEPKITQIEKLYSQTVITKQTDTKEVKTK